MQRLQKIKLVSVLVIITVLFAGCSKSNVADKESAYGYAVEEAVYEAPRMAMKSVSVSNTSAGFTADAVAYDAAPEPAPSVESYERKLIKTGNITVQVPDLAEIETKLETWCASLGGYVSYSSSDETSSYYTVKIPSNLFDSAFETVGTFGQVKNRNVSVSDVSEQYYDLQTRLQTKKVLQKNLTSYLERADNLTDILKIEKELNNVTSEIESMEGQMRRLTDRIDYSTLSVMFVLPEGKTDPAIQKPTFSENVHSFLLKVKNFFMSFLKCVLYAVVCGIPCIAFVALLYWLLFGKVGLVLRIFRKLKK
ncbi:MAG: DUF4349 domain-containing protein [Sphaerochaetaceae bacterium]|nr:DUF4349 domain-containing protein [Sphaerochaetaceae bacterium]